MLLFRKTTYSRLRKQNCFSQLQTSISRGYFPLGALNGLCCGLWAETPLTFWLYRELGLGVAAGQAECPTPGFPDKRIEGEHQGTLAGGGQSREGEEW